MANCENCIHNEVCKNYEPKSTIACERYKDNSLIVELPCKVGDTVFAFCDFYGVVLPYFIETLDISYYTKNENCYQYEANSTNAEQNDLIDSIDFLLEDIGKTVFLSREEAEKALKEDKNV